MPTVRLIFMLASGFRYSRFSSIWADIVYFVKTVLRGVPLGGLGFDVDADYGKRVDRKHIIDTLTNMSKPLWRCRGSLGCEAAVRTCNHGGRQAPCRRRAEWHRYQV